MARDLGVKITEKDNFYFISYNSEDQERVSKYVKELDLLGFPMWYDKGLHVGNKWKKEIAERISKCDAVVMFITNGIFKKSESFVYKEYEFAGFYEKKVYIIYLDKIDRNIIPYDLVDWWIDLQNLHGIVAYDYPTEKDCAKKIVESVGFTSTATTPTQKDSSTTITVKTRLNFGNGYYEGDVLNGKPHGKGVYVWNNGDRYEGDFADDKRHGKGVFVWNNGNRYEGDFVDDKQTGKGVFVWNNGARYEGDFVDNKRTGKGVFVWNNGKRYEGDFVDGYFHGKGVFVGNNGDRYEGDFVDGYFHGKGVFVWNNGDRYEGDFVDDKIHGKGTYKRADGTVETGVWENGEKVDDPVN